MVCSIAETKEGNQVVKLSLYKTPRKKTIIKVPGVCISNVTRLNEPGD